MKSNDNIPRDEMLLAEALAAAKRNGLNWCSETPFADCNGDGVENASDAVAVCALGALHFARRVNMTSRFLLPPEHPLANVAAGNDTEDDWTSDDEDNPGDRGESLGWAFRQAMEG